MSYEPLKSGALQDENIQMVNWWKYSNSNNSISKYTLPANLAKLYLVDNHFVKPQI